MTTNDKIKEFRDYLEKECNRLGVLSDGESRIAHSQSKFILGKFNEIFKEQGDE